MSRLGTYESNGDRLKLCLAQYGDTNRPDGFTAGKDREVYEFKRVKR